MSLATKASIARTIMFRSRGVNYSAFLHALAGNLVQQYDADGNYYPEFTPAAPERVSLTVTSSASVGAVLPDSVEFLIDDTPLAFDATGACTTSGAESYFRKDGADLLIIGNIAQYLSDQPGIITAKVTKGSDIFYGYIPVEVSERKGGFQQKVSIAPDDNKNFTLTSFDDSVKLKAGVLEKSGWVYNSIKYSYIWQIADPSEASGWRTLKSGPGVNGTLTLPADEVDTYANIRCLVSRTGSVIQIGSDCVGVVDASDPLDIILAVKINETGTGAETDAVNAELDDSMPDAAYIVFIPTMVRRGSSTSVGATTWLQGNLLDPAGIQTRLVTPVSGKYKVLVSDIKSARGEHTLIMHGELS